MEQEFNNQNNRLKFTTEVEVNYSINFPDLTLTRDCFGLELVQKRVDRFYNSKCNSETKPTYISTPYIPDLSERLNKSLKNHNMALGCKTVNNIGNLYIRTKYKIPDMINSKLIYRIDYLDCPAKYPGNTKQRLGRRISRVT